MNVIKEFQGPHRWLSNFWPCDIEFCGFSFASVEAAYQASKTNDYAEWERFTNYSPYEAKKEGRKLKLRQDWDAVKVMTMRQLLLRKFEDPVLRQKLLDTGDTVLVEGNGWGDTFWGICKGIGDNNLGKLLMEIRERLKKN